MKKGIFALTAFSTVSALSLVAQESHEYFCPPQPCSDPCDPCREQLFVERSQLFVSAEFLYWTVEEGVLDYAVRMDKSTPATETFAIGDYKTADYEWRPGYRVALAWYNCPSYWEATAQYTWFYDKGSDSTEDPSETDRFLNPTWETITGPPFRKARSLISLHYHVGDLTVARVFNPNPHLRLRLLGGFTSSYIKQNWKIHYSNFQKSFDKLENKWRFWGGGARVGINIDWFWGGQFYLTGRSSFATLIGTYKNEATQTINNNIIVRDATYDDHRFTMHTQFILGPSWQVPCDCWSLELFAGYEFNIWFNLQETFRSQLSDIDETKETRHARGLLGLHGFTGRLTFGF